MASTEVLLGGLLASTGEAVVTTDRRGRVLHVSRAFEAAFGFAPGELVGQPLACCGGVVGQPSVADLVASAMDTGVCAGGAVASPLLRGGCELAALPVLEAGSVAGCVAILRQAAAAADQREGFDKLTGLPNRHLFVDRVEQTLHSARRSGKSAAIMLIGIDRFSDINDVLGRQDGDRVLVGVTERLRQCVRTSDTVARLESDRFAFVMQIAAIDDSVLLTEKILRAFELPVSLGGQRDVAVTGSVGVSIFPADGAAPEELIKNAAVALHHAQQGGRHRSQFFSDRKSVV